MRKSLLLILFGLMAVLPISAQNLSVSGKVTNSADGSPVIGATVVARESQKATSTDKDGHFTLRLSSVDKNLDFSFIGMKSVSMTVVKSKKVYNVSLEEVYTNLDAVVAIGYGVQAKRDLTGAITSISAEDIEQNSGGDLNIALQGKVPGMQIISTSGEPGAGANISIRGSSSINGSNEPLYIVDGVPIETGNITSIDGDASFSAISGLNPSDVESVEVLKDAASAAIYGSRAANGVVIITTKGGQKLEAKPPVITVSHTSSIVSNSRNLDVLTATEFREMYIEARKNNGQTATSNWISNPYSPLYYRSTDWQDAMFRTVYQTRNDINVRGSSKDFSYSISLGYRDLSPTVVYTSYEQLNSRANFTYKVGKNIKAGTSISFAKQDYRRILTGSSNLQSVMSTIVKSNPCFSPYDFETGEMVIFMGANEIRNPMALAKYVPNNFDRQWTVLNQYFEFDLAKNLKFRTQLSMQTDQSSQGMYTPRMFDQTTNIDKGSYNKTNKRRFDSESYFSYRYNKKGHKFDAMAGFSMQRNESNSITLNGQDYLDGDITKIQNAAVYTTITDNDSENALMSYFARLNYNYKGRYILSATLRHDGSSRFGKDNRWGTFPAASFGWRFSDEKFMKWTKKVLYDGKLRLSYGMTGNQSIGNYAWRGTYSSGGDIYDGSTALMYSSPSNFELGWETTEQYNAGLDLSFFEGRVSLTVDAYLKDSKDLLFNVPTPYYTGFSSMAMNNGAIRNKGLEFLLETVNTKGRVRWTTSFNLSLNRSEVRSLPNGEDLIVSSLSLARVGQPVGVFYAHKALGIYSRDEDNFYSGPNVATVGTQRRKGSAAGEVFKGGDVIWADINNDGVINDDDRCIVGDPNPDFIGGLGNTISYKGWTFNIFFQYSFGNDIMNDFRRDRNAFEYARNTGRDVLRSWRKQGDITDRPICRYSDPMENYRRSSMWIEDGSYIRLKNLSLSYTFNFKKSQIKALKLTFTGTNLLTWSDYSGYDPEVNTSTNPFVMGVDAGAYPRSRSFNFGVDLTF